MKNIKINFGNFHRNQKMISKETLKTFPVRLLKEYHKR